MKMTLVDFLLARIAEDEANLPGASDGWYALSRYEAECKAKRRIVNASVMYHEGNEDPNPDDPDGGWALALALYALAEVYAEHPDYDERWRR